MNQKQKEIVKAVFFIVTPFASIFAAIHYAPKVKKWYVDRKKEKEENNVGSK